MLENNNTNTLHVDKTYSEIILDLKILSKLKINQKLCIIDNKLTIDVSYLQSMSRYINNSSRIFTIDYLENLYRNLSDEIEKIIKVLISDTNNNNNNYLIEDPSKILMDLNHNLKISLVGINNLIQTYITDDVLKSRLEILINNIDLKMRKISELLVVKI